MNVLTRALDIFEQYQGWYGRVAPAGSELTCPWCLGPVSTGYEACGGCDSLFGWGDAPESLAGRIVPMTTVVNNRPWYSALRNYKLAQWSEYSRPVGALAFLWLTAHGARLEEMLGGRADAITIVPSKKPGITYDNQPLRKVLGHFGERLNQTLQCTRPDLQGRRTYAPEMFEAVGDVRGKRFIVVEDTWTTGATGVSACGALLAAGAESVVLTPIGRLINSGYCLSDHPYWQHVAGVYDLADFPR